MVQRTRLAPDDLPGYRLADRIHLGAETEVYRALQRSTGRPVMVKVLASDYPDPDQVARLTHEYEVGRSLELDGVVPVIALERFRNSLALVTDDFGGEALRQQLDRQRPELAETLVVAARLAEVLEELHRHEVVHRDNLVLLADREPQSQE